MARILETVEQLAANPHPAGVRKLVSSEHSYRVREGVYRVVYNIVSSTLIRVGHRKDITIDNKQKVAAQSVCFYR